MVKAAPDTDLGTAALEYAANGWRVFPCHLSKRPLVEGGFHAATRDAGHITDWWARWPDASIGAAVPETLAVIDVDGDRGRATLRELARPHGGLPETLVCETGGGGFHLYYLHPGGELRQGAGILGPGLDTRMPDKGYTILPPSPHPSGKPYAWRDPDVDFARMPDWLAELLRPPRVQTPPPPAPAPEVSDKYVQAAIDGECEAVGSAPVGTRNETLHRSACSLGTLVGAGLLAESDARRALLAAAAGYIATDGEIAAQRTIRSGLRWGMSNPREVAK